MNKGNNLNISLEEVVIPPSPLPFEEKNIFNNNKTILNENNNLIQFTTTILINHNPYALVLALVPILTIFGNSMVILAVRKEKSLQSVTNYLIVSLASADLLVAICVMFFAVYYEWNSFVWDLGPSLCNLYIGADVACSTASILNLLAISIDRYIAVSHPLAYCQIGANSSRACLSIALVWGVSIAVAVPVAFGVNHIEHEYDCSFTNPIFMIGSSILSFFVPCLAMIALYAVIFRRLREREKARNLRKRGQISSGSSEGALVLNALMGGARMARQIAKSHLKDQLLLELSVQTSSFPSPSDEDEEEIIKKEELNNNKILPLKNGNIKILTINNLKQSNILPNQRNGKRKNCNSQNIQKLLLIRRCNSVPSAIIRKWPSLKTTIKQSNKNKNELNNKLLLKEEYKKSFSKEKLTFCSEIEELNNNIYLNNNNCNISIQKSFGDEINESLPFIDSCGSSSISASSPFISNKKIKKQLIKQLSSNLFNNNNLNNNNNNKQPQSLPTSIEPKRKILENTNNFLLIYNQITNSSFSLPNLLQTKINNNNNNKILEKEKEETLKGKLTDWLRGIFEWSRNNTKKLKKEEIIEEQKSNTSTTCNRSIRISSFNNNNCFIQLNGNNNNINNNKTLLNQQKQQQSPLKQKIKNVFRRSLLTATIDEKKQLPSSKQLIKKATKQMRREQKATVTLAVVLVVFLCCWVPFFALHLSNALCLISGGQQCVHMLAMFLCTWLGYLNSSLNPLIYTVFDKRFRKAFRDLLGCCLGPSININSSGGLQRRRLK